MSQEYNDRCPYPKPDKTIAYGKFGEEVKWVQWNLNRVSNADLLIDGIYGILTKNAVLQYQRSLGWTGTGICGYKTVDAMNQKEE